MSLLSLTQVPVKVYRWDDVGAPVLDKTVGSVGLIIKACLVTGYGTKSGAGWSLTHEDAGTKSRIYSFNHASAEQLGLRVWGEDTWRINVALVSDIVDANTATVVANCASPFMHYNPVSTGKWVLIASDRGFWFFDEHTGYHATNKCGAYLFAGVTPSVVEDFFVMRHTGGSYVGDGSQPNRLGVTYYGITTSEVVPAVVYNLQTRSLSTSLTTSVLDGFKNRTQPACVMPIFAVTDTSVCYMPVYASSRNDQVNFSVINDNRSLMCFCTNTKYQEPDSNAYVPTDYWEY